MAVGITPSDVSRKSAGVEPFAVRLVQPRAGVAAGVAPAGPTVAAGEGHRSVRHRATP